MKGKNSTKRLKIGQKITIEWDDHYDLDAVTMEEIVNTPHLTLRTRGYYMGENERYYFLARDYVVGEFWRDSNKYCGYVKSSSRLLIEEE